MNRGPGILYIHLILSLLIFNGLAQDTLHSSDASMLSSLVSDRETGAIGGAIKGMLNEGVERAETLLAFMPSRVSIGSIDFERGTPLVDAALNDLEQIQTILQQRATPLQDFLIPKVTSRQFLLYQSFVPTVVDTVTAECDRASTPVAEILQTEATQVPPAPVVTDKDVLAEPTKKPVKEPPSEPQTNESPPGLQINKSPPEEQIKECPPEKPTEEQSLGILPIDTSGEDIYITINMPNEIKIPVVSDHISPTSTVTSSTTTGSPNIVQPTAQAAAETTTGPPARPTTGPTTQPTTGPTTQPTTGPTTQPTTGPTTQTTTGPTTQTTTGPTTQTTTGPPKQVATQPTAQNSEPVDQSTTKTPTLATSKAKAGGSSKLEHVPSCLNTMTHGIVASLPGLFDGGLFRFVPNLAPGFLATGDTGLTADNVRTVIQDRAGTFHQFMAAVAAAVETRWKGAIGAAVAGAPATTAITAGGLVVERKGPVRAAVNAATSTFDAFMSGATGTFKATMDEAVNGFIGVFDPRPTLYTWFVRTSEPITPAAKPPLIRGFVENFTRLVPTPRDGVAEALTMHAALVPLGLGEEIRDLCTIQPHLIGLFEHFNNPRTAPTFLTLFSLFNDIRTTGILRNREAFLPLLKPFMHFGEPLGTKLGLANAVLDFLNLMQGPSIVASTMTSSISIP